jgi:hypothetical protein
MFGWRKVGRSYRNGTRRRFGFALELMRSGQWLSIYWGARTFQFTRYTLARHTGPEENRSVLGYFFGGAERRRRNSGFTRRFKERGARPPLTREEIQRRNREAIAAGVVRPLW